MGCFYEINDTLLLDHSQGFPFGVFDYCRHIENPVTTDDVKDMIFEFHGKTSPRAFQLDPVRVFFVEYTENGKWLVWGKAFIQSLTIEHKPQRKPDPYNPIKFVEGDWVTSGTYKVVEVYDPEYQRIFTSHEVPAAWNYFADDSERPC